MSLIGFARVSTTEQSLEDQVSKLNSAGCIKIFQGKHSGKAASNEGLLEELLEYVREGDTVVVTKLDRLGRSLKQVLSVLEQLKQRGVGFKALDQGIDTSKKDDPIAVAMIQLLGMFAELERNFIVTRTREGKEASGNFGGRPSKLTQEERESIRISKDNNSTLARRYNVSRATVINIKKKTTT